MHSDLGHGVNETLKNVEASAEHVFIFEAH